ncbi:hypothetical protein BH11PSE8_BH11PSE8_25870 [soil metagenome]
MMSAGAAAAAAPEHRAEAALTAADATFAVPPLSGAFTRRRADRLFQIVQLVRGRRLSTAQFIAQRLEVSERTVFRDVADLMAQGVPIEGEERETECTLRPLGCFYWSAVWTLDARFRDEPGRMLADLFRQVEAEMTSAAEPPSALSRQPASAQGS